MSLYQINNMEDGSAILKTDSAYWLYETIDMLEAQGLKYEVLIEGEDEELYQLTYEEE